MKLSKTLIPAALATLIVAGAAAGTGCNPGATNNTGTVVYGEECYEKLQYIDNVLRDRDCINGENFELAQRWINWNLMEAGYKESEIEYQPVTYTRYLQEASLSSVNGTYELADENHYTRQGWQYVADENGSYVKANLTTDNIIIKKQGKSDKQIIVGAHYDGTGTGDNGSGVALALTTAQKLYSVSTQYTVVFVFFTAEEIGCYGSTAYAEAMTEDEVDKTLYMINLDSLVCGDYTYLYGGVQDNENKIVTDTEAYYNAVAVAESLGLDFKSNPWTWDNLSPADQSRGRENPSYASPSTGDWSDHAGFKARGIQYVYFEATNWEIPDYTGYGETYLIGMLMNTENDYLEYIEKYFPGRPLSHLNKYSALLYALVTQASVNF